MALRAGDAVEHFVVVSLLGHGGMGEVYLARDTQLGRQVALKILRVEPATAPGVAAERDARLLEEARAAATLEHPNVVTVYEIGETADPEGGGKHRYIAMELVRGRTLRAALDDATIPMEERVRWLTDVARALAAAHGAGLVHGDVKPENVMVRDDGVVKVLDFGIARAAAPATGKTDDDAFRTLTGDGVTVGTPRYMAPEQMRQERLDGRADQFAWGVVAYEVLARVPAWGEELSALALVSRVLSEEPSPLETVCPAAPKHVVDVVKRAMAKRRTARFATMGEVVRALEDAGRAYAPTVPVSTKRDGAPEAPGSAPEAPPSRARAVRVAVGVGGLAIAIGTGVGAWRAGARDVHATGDPCTGQAECARAHPEEAYVCRASDHQCVAVASEDCTPRYEAGDRQHDDTVWLGALLPLHGPAADAYGAMHANAVEMARREIAAATSALDGEGASTRVRRVAWVMCDDGANGGRAARHLVEDVGVPAIVGFKDGQEVIDLAGGYLIKRGVMALASITSSPTITRLPQPTGPRLVWRSMYSMESVASAIAAMTTSFFEPRLRTAGAPLRVVVVRDESLSGRALGEALFRTLRYNGKSAVENGADYDEAIVRPDEMTAHDPARLLPRLVAMRPSLVVFALNDGDAWLVDAAERALAQANAPLPTWLHPNGSLEPFSGLLGPAAERGRRMFSLVSTSDSVENARFVLRYNEAHAPPVTRGTNPASTYDAAYLLSYAVFAQAAGPVTGSGLAEGLSRLSPPGRPIAVGPDDVLPGVSALAAGEAIDLRGAGGALDFDRTTGEALVDFALRCRGVERAGEPAGQVESGLVYRAGTRTVEGTVRCPGR